MTFKASHFALSKKRHPVWLALQIIVSLTLLTWLFTREDFGHHLLSVFVSANLGWLLVGLLAAGIVQALCFLRWYIFLRMVGLDMHWIESVGIFFAGLFCNIFFPGGVGGDFVKIGILATRGRDPGRAALSVIMDRLAGSIAMIVLGAILMASKYQWLMQSPHVAHVVQFIFVYFILVALLIVFSVLLCRRGIVERLPSAWPGRSRLLELTTVYFQCAIKWKCTLIAILLSVCMLAIYFLSYYFAALAYGVAVPVLDFLAILPTVDIISGMPVSLGGFGVREGLFVLLLGQLNGISPEVAVSISLCGYMLSAIWALPGALLWLLHKKTI